MKTAEEKRKYAREWQKKYRQTEKGKKYYKEYEETYYNNVRLKSNNNRRILKNIKSRAKMRDLEFNLTLEDIVIPEYCPILGIRLDQQGSNDFLPSVDRIDNAKGYIKGNIVIISSRANRIKSDASLDELNNIVNFYNRLVKRDDQ